MGTESATPDTEIEPEIDDTPPAEPVADAVADDRTDQPAPERIAQAEYTRATQQNAAIRKELGLPKGASTADFLEAMAARNADNESDDTDPVDDDPRIVEANQRAMAAELRVQSAVYGEEFANDALELLNAARTSNDVEELFALVAGFRDKHAAPAGAPVAAAASSEPAAAAEQPQGDTGLSEGDRVPRLRESTPPGKRESAVASHIRGLFQAAAERR